ncbi:hypothetical protein [Paenibacillus rhizophilus]|nr:hypothetical protein [Paenibacillus rhizophilus]
MKKTAVLLYPQFSEYELTVAFKIGRRRAFLNGRIILRNLWSGTEI